MEFHHDTITVSDVAEVIAVNDAGVQAYVSGPHLGVQFHPEITPDCFSGWRKGFTSARSGSDDGKIDTRALAVEIDSAAPETAARCDRLVERFLEHAGISITAAGGARSVSDEPRRRRPQTLESARRLKSHVLVGDARGVELPVGELVQVGRHLGDDVA
jgi:hypothetical protein